MSSTVCVHNEGNTSFSVNISFIMRGKFVRLHTNKSNMSLNKYPKFREFSLYSHFLRNKSLIKLIKNMAITRNIYTRGILFDIESLHQNAHYCFEKKFKITKTKRTFNVINNFFVK